MTLPCDVMERYRITLPGWQKHNTGIIHHDYQRVIDSSVPVANVDYVVLIYQLGVTNTISNYYVQIIGIVRISGIFKHEFTRRFALKFHNAVCV